MLTIEQIKNLKESEDKVEFKAAHDGNYAYDGGSRTSPSKRRRSILGYVTALANEGGGHIIFGVKDQHPHEIVGTTQYKGNVGGLESRIYNDTRIRVNCYELY